MAGQNWRVQKPILNARTKLKKSQCIAGQNWKNTWVLVIFLTRLEWMDKTAKYFSL